MSPKLNVGCGKDILDGWVNIDRYPTDERVVQGDIRALDYPAGTVGAIRAKDVLEHIPRAETLPTLRHWFAVLEPRGTIEIRCPDARKQCELFLAGTWNGNTWAQMVFGLQDGLGNFHMAGFDADFLVELVTEAGFVNVTVTPEHDDVPVDGNANLRLCAMKPSEDDLHSH